MRELELLSSGESPFATEVPAEDARGASWVQPVLVADVQSLGLGDCRPRRRREPVVARAGLERRARLGPVRQGRGHRRRRQGPGPAPAADEPPPPAAVLPPAIKTPSTKRCVGKPPRQTEDPLAPPCVASFTGDNFGVTYQGVNKDEVSVLFYFDGFINDIGTSQGGAPAPGAVLRPAEPADGGRARLHPGAAGVAAVLQRPVPDLRPVRALLRLLRRLGRRRRPAGPTPPTTTTS